MTNESKFRHETVTHCNSGAAEFLALAEELGIDLGAMVDPPRTELCDSAPQVRPDPSLDRLHVGLQKAPPFLISPVEWSDWNVS
jgi:hypothetical protein